MTDRVAYRGEILHFLNSAHDENSYEHISDGLLVVEAGEVVQIGSYSEVKKGLDSGTEVIDYSGHLLTPGFIDSHIHYPQTEIIASYGEELLEWLNDYVFPTEGKYYDKKHASSVAKFFLQELLRNGTTTAVIYSTMHKVAAEALFEEAEKLNMRIINGKILMNRNAPDYLCDKSIEVACDETRELINTWHGKGRASYVITPRFAPTSTEEQLEATSSLMQEFPDVYMQTHISENRNEVVWVKELFPWAKDYTDVYDHYGMLGPKSIYGHAIYLSEREFTRFHDTESVIAWCPTSNFFLGSGMFDLAKAREYKVRISMGTDVGGGSSFSMLRTLNEAYKVAAVRGAKLSPFESFYHITLGNAKALSLDDKIGNFKSGKEADFLVLDLDATPLLRFKMERAETLADKLFNLCVLGDDRVIKAAYIYGKLQHQK